MLRGGGDLATGVAYRLHQAGFPIVVCELAQPLTVRRTVALSTAISDGSNEVNGMIGTRAESPQEALAVAATGAVPVVVCPDLPSLPAQVVVDARMAKHNIDTKIGDAPLVIGLGPGFVAGKDCHVVIETARGHELGRVINQGAAQTNTGIPGEIGGKSAERVLRAPTAGGVEWKVGIGDVVSKGETLGWVGGLALVAPFAGLLRGLIAPGSEASTGQKIGDIDPRLETSAVSRISDKALAVGGGVLEAVLAWLNRST